MHDKRLALLCSRKTRRSKRACIPEVVHVGDLLHAQPAELTGTHGAVHAVAAAIVGLHDVGAAARAGLDLLCIFSNRGSV